MIGLVVLLVIAASYFVIVRDPADKCIELRTWARAPHHKGITERVFGE